MRKKLIVLSYDSLQSRDLEKLQTMPFFSKIMERAAVVRNIREIYPTLTYPIHTTIVTGLYPDRHGIAHNQKPAVDPNDPDFSVMGSNWYWRKDNITAKTLTDSVLEEGRTAATVLWPVTAGEKRGWNLPEIWPTRETGGSVRQLYADASSDNVMSEYFDRFIGKYRWNGTEDMVCYAVEIALDIVRRHSPDLLLCHVTQLDHIRHVYGVQNREVDDCLRQLDVIAGRFMDAARDAGTLDETNFVILGDHGQIDISKVFHLNALFRQNGLISADHDGKVSDYDAYGFSAGFSTHVIMKDPKNQEVKAQLRHLLGSLPSQYPQCVEAVYTSEDVLRDERLAGEFSFVLEAREGVLFANEILSDVVTGPDAPREKPYKAMHGHHPSKGEKPPFVAFGPDVKTALRIENGSVIDVAPTLAALAGVALPQAEGKPFPLLL
ncbi:MAG: alkaline phosphatase family protein [Synergistaceae bacterium]|jgi:predicted AlkP superfamily pyrophosphatase or phosphodiesterase|nr:alkaline phosphatase family protein [Synergistaceae bacterium]